MKQHLAPQGGVRRGSLEEDAWQGPGNSGGRRYERLPPFRISAGEKLAAEAAGKMNRGS